MAPCRQHETQALEPATALKLDILSDVLRTVRLSGAIFFDVSVTSPWVAEAVPASRLIPHVMPGAQHLIEYHVLISGRCWATLVDTDESPVPLSAGSVIVFPQGDAHALSSAPDMRTRPDLSVFDQPGDLAPPYYVSRSADGPVDARMICGFIGCDALPFNPVIQALPRMLHVPDVYGSGDGWLGTLIQAVMRESNHERAGSGSVLSRLSELIFIEAVRAYIEALPAPATGWLSALTDRALGRAIQVIHDRPDEPWTLESLAREAGLSRTLLVERFTGHLGVPPMTYLANWRMQIAAGRLLGGGEPLARIATDVGYESESAFSRAFKRATGLAPGTWRAKNSRGNAA